MKSIEGYFNCVNAVNLPRSDRECKTADPSRAFFAHTGAGNRSGKLFIHLIDVEIFGVVIVAQEFRVHF